jgi:hypothetical protein
MAPNIATNGNQKKPLCFVIGPFGEPGSQTREWSDFLFHKVIEPVLNQDYLVERSIDKSESGQITTHIRRDLQDASIVIADLSGSNPNAYYELGFRHALDLPFIHLVRANDKQLPFDIQGFSVIPVKSDFVESQGYYTIRDTELQQVQESLRAQVDNISNNPRQRSRVPFSPKVYSWDVFYSPRIAIDWLATQPETIRNQISAYESRRSADDMCDESLTLLAEYLALKAAASLNGEGTIFMVTNNLTNQLDLGYAVFKFSSAPEPILINVKDVCCYGDGVASITFKQESRPFPVERGGRTVNVLIPGYKYTLPVSFSEGDGTAKGVIIHPKSRTTIGDAELSPRFGFR